MPFPEHLADARATILDPARVKLHPALIQHAWAQLKAATGHPIARPELLLPAHVISTTTPEDQPGGTLIAINAAQRRLHGRLQELAQRTPKPLGAV